MDVALPCSDTTQTETVPSLKELLEDGIYLLFLLRSGHHPHDASEFNRRVDEFLSRFRRNAQAAGKSPESVQDALYAFCALMDEIVLASPTPIRDAWELQPLQLRLFGEHLAGEGFFQKLEMLRLDPVRHLESLEVFHACLLLGFQGRYLIEGQEKLGYLITRLSQEIAQVRGGRSAFAPHWQPAFRFQEFLRHELPLGAYFSFLLVVAIGFFLAFSLMLKRQVGHVSHQSSMTTPARTQELA